MYRSKRAKWIRIIVLISFFLSYLPFILLYNYINTLPEYTSLFNDCITCGNSIFFPWFSSINLLEVIPMKEHLIPFSLGNLLDIILFTNLASYFDALLYHYFVKRIISESENRLECNSIYYYYQPINKSDNHKRDVGSPRIINPSEDDFPFTIEECNWGIKGNTSPYFSRIKYDGKSNITIPLRGASHKYNLFIIEFNQSISSSLSDYYFPYFFHLSLNLSIDLPIHNFFLVFIYESSDKEPLLFNYLITSSDFHSSFILKLEYFFPFSSFHVHTITPNLRKKNWDLGFHFILKCEILFLITDVYAVVLRNGIKQIKFKSTNKNYS